MDALLAALAALVMWIVGILPIVFVILAIFGAIFVAVAVLMAVFVGRRVKQMDNMFSSGWHS